MAMAARTAARVVTFGRGPADVRAEDVRLDDRGRPGFRLASLSGSALVQLRLYGEHNVHNALAAAALAGELGMPVAEIAERLSAAETRSRWRMEVTERPDGVTVINDAYNSNPEAVRAALGTLTVLARGRRSFAVLGPDERAGRAVPGPARGGRRVRRPGRADRPHRGRRGGGPHPHRGQGRAVLGRRAAPCRRRERCPGRAPAPAGPGRRRAGQGITLGGPGAGRARPDRDRTAGIGTAGIGTAVAGGRRSEDHPVRGGSVAAALAVRHAAGHPDLLPARLRPADPGGGPGRRTRPSAAPPPWAGPSS